MGFGVCIHVWGSDLPCGPRAPQRKRGEQGKDGRRGYKAVACRDLCGRQKQHPFPKARIPPAARSVRMSVAAMSTHSSSRDISPRRNTSSHRSSRSSAPRSTRSQSSYSTASSSAPSRFESYSPTTMSSYHRRIEAAAAGLPDSSYFSSGQSRTVRRREWVTAPTPPSAAPAPTPSAVGGGRSAIGKDIARYQPGAVEKQSRESEDDGLDSRTVLPEDSISQLSGPSSYSASSRGRTMPIDSRRATVGSGGSTFSRISTFQGDRVFEEARNRYLIERRPRASASAR